MSSAEELIPKFATMNIAAPSPSTMTYYVIFKGTCPGIFTDPVQVLHLIDCVPNAHVGAFPTWHAALFAWRHAISTGEVVPRAPPSRITWVVIRGRVPGIYHSWNDTHRQIHRLRNKFVYYHVMTTIEAAEKAWLQAERNGATAKVDCEVAISEADLEFCRACLADDEYDWLASE